MDSLPPHANLKKIEPEIKLSENLIIVQRWYSYTLNILLIVTTYRFEQMKTQENVSRLYYMLNFDNNIYVGIV